MIVAQLTNNDEGAVFASEMLMELAEKIGAYTIMVDSDQDVYLLCKHPVTGELNNWSLFEVVSSMTNESPEEDGGSTVVQFKGKHKND